MSTTTRSLCKSLYKQPKKTKFGDEKSCRVRLTNQKEVNAYIPEKVITCRALNCMIRGGRVKDLPGVRYHIIRGALDTSGVEGRHQRRSKYGTKRPKK